jgi:replicative DNA helicase
VAEERLLELLLANKELRKIILPRLVAADYENLASAPVFRALISLDTEDQEIGFDSLSAATGDDSHANELLARLMMTETTQGFDESLTAADSCLNALRLTQLDRDIDELGSALAEAERAADGEKLNRLAMDQLDLKKRRGALLARSQTPESPAR